MTLSVLLLIMAFILGVVSFFVWPARLVSAAVVLIAVASLLTTGGIKVG